MPIKLDQRPVIAVGDTDFAKVDYTDYLDSTELLTGTPLVDEVTTTDLTITSKAINVASVRILERDVGIGKAVQFKVSGQKVNTEYTIRITVSTDGGRTCVRDAILKAI
jgi:hypothetical protein